jgi:hypothetical protein
MELTASWEYSRCWQGWSYCGRSGTSGQWNIGEARNQIDQAGRIDDAFDPPFPLDLIVRPPSFPRELGSKSFLYAQKIHR